MAVLTQRGRMIQLMWLTWAFSLLGLDNGILDPSLTGLAHNVHSKTVDLNPIFPIHGLGFMAGILMCSFLVKLNHLYIGIFCSILFGAIVNIVIPVCTTLIGLTALFGVQGLVKGFIDIYIFTLVLKLFPVDNSWQMLMIPASASFASFLIPFAVKPFQSHLSILPGANITSVTDCTEKYCFLVPSRVFYPYLFTALIVIPPIIAFLVYSYQDECSEIEHYEVMPDKPQLPPMDCRDKWVLGLILFLFHIPVVGIIIGYSNLLSLYGTSSPLFLSKTVMAYMTSLFWGFLLLGRVINVILSKYFDMETLNSVNFVGLIIFACFLLIHQISHIKFFLWFGTGGYAFFQSSFMPSIMAWVGTFVDLDIILLSTCLFSNSFGELIIPYLAALMFSDVSHGSLIYIVFTVTILEAGLYVSMVIFKRYRLYSGEP